MILLMTLLTSASEVSSRLRTSRLLTNYQAIDTEIADTNSARVVVHSCYVPREYDNARECWFTASRSHPCQPLLQVQAFHTFPNFRPAFSLMTCMSLSLFNFNVKSLILLFHFFLFSSTPYPLAVQHAVNSSHHEPCKQY